MAADFKREEVTTTVVRLVADAPLDGNPDLDQDPGYRRIWLEPTDEGVAVCFEKTRTEVAR